MKKVLLISFVSFSFSMGLMAQNGVSINTDGSSPDASAILDAKATDKGILIPRVALTATNSASPITSPATGLMVYNTATAGTPPNNVTPGFYFWNSASWSRFTTGNTTEWRLGGNTVGAASSLGTIDNFALPIITDNTERIRVLSTGEVGIGTPTPNQRLEVAGDINVTTGNGFRINNTATSGQYLRGDGTRFVSSAILAADLPSGSDHYIQNQNSTDQTGNFRISGSGRANTSFISPVYTSLSADVALRSPASQVVRIQSGGATDRIVVASGGGVTVSNMPATGTGVTIDMTAGTGAGATGLSIGSFASNTNARNGISVDLTNTSNSNGISISNVGATGMNGIQINATAANNGTGIRMGNTNSLQTGMNITASTSGIIVNSNTAGSGTGISIGSSTTPNIGIATTASGTDNYGGRFLGNASGIGVLGSATSGAYPSIPTFIPLIGVRGYAASNSTTASDHHYGLYGFAERAGTGNASHLNYGVFGSVAINSTTNAGLGAGVYGTVSTTSSYAGTGGGFGGLFNAASSSKAQALAAIGGADVYLGSSDADRPASLTTFLGTGNTNTTRMFNTRISGTQTFVGSTSGTVGISAPATVTSYSWVLPTAQGTANQVLRNDGSGNLSWVTPAAGTVTSVALTVPTGLSVTGSPITTSGTLAISTTLSGPVRGNGSGFTTGNTNLASEVTGILPLANGGSNANLTATNGGVVWSNASQMQITSAGTSGQILRSNGAAAPTWDNGDGLFIQNQNASNQTANYRITGTGRANTSFDAPLVQSISGNLTIQSQAGGKVAINTNGATERVTVTSDGKVGIGETSPTVALTVNGGYRGKYRNVSTTTALDETDYLIEITGDNDITITFPDPSVVGAGTFLVVRLNYAAGDKTFASFSGSQIHLVNMSTPLASIVVPLADTYTSSIFVSNGSVWLQIR